jgi:hypothetical protein
MTPDPAYAEPALSRLIISPMRPSRKQRMLVSMIGFCDVYVDRAMPIIETNMRCFLEGRVAEMTNLVTVTS